METWTVLELIKWTTDYFRRSGIENPRLNAEVLLGHVLGLERIMLYARFEQPVGPEEREAFRELVRRRAQRIPLQHLVGSWEFRSREFSVTTDVLIPRPDTEFLVDRCLTLLPEDADGWVADIGTGSGIVAVSLAAERPSLHVLAVDVSEAALAVAGRNAEAHGVADRINLVHGDLLAPLVDALPRGVSGLQMIASNPPYIPTAEIGQLEPEVREHEPRIALDGGTDGLVVVRRLVVGAPAQLAPGGWLVMELGPGQAEKVQRIADDTGKYDMQTVDVLADTAGRRRVFSVARREEG